MPTEPTARVYTVILPPDLAEKAEALAERDSRSMDELFREALNAYYTQNIHNSLLAIGEYAASRNPGYTEDDIPRLIAETRAEAALSDIHK